jgi:ferric-dicitrate binding protein FerR (iron transport regulator)
MNKETIYRYLSGELSDDQIKELLAWSYKNETNRKYFSRIKNLWTASKLDISTPDLDLKKEFALLNFKIEKITRKNKISSQLLSL